MPTQHIQTLRDLIGRKKGVLLPGAPNALAARVVADLGFESIYLTGAGLTNMHLGLPDLGFMDPAVSVNVLFGVKYQDDPERFEQLKAEVERDTSAWGLAELYEAQSVIDPRDTRDYLIRTLDVHTLRMKNGVGEHHLRNWPTSY